MYPNLYFFFKKVFDLEINWLRFINTFGFFVALAFMVSYWLLQKELKRKQSLNMFEAIIVEEEVGLSASIYELLINFLSGFLLGFKIIGLFSHSSDINFNPQNFIFSAQGSIIGGLLIALIFAGIKWNEKNKQKLDKPRIIKKAVYPIDRANDILMITFVFTFIGAKLFHNLENWSVFIKDPLGEMLSFGGLTFYGGLICAVLANYFYFRKYKVPFLPILDAAVPALIIGYAIGRLGCQFSGDGDWGILNSAYISDINANLVVATKDQFKQALINNSQYYQFQYDSLNLVPHINFKANILPQFLVSQNYPNNVINEGFRLSNCAGAYCAYLPVGVFPTPLYESIISGLLFILIWNLRKQIKYTGQLAALYFILSGTERFFIEKIRVNNLYHIGGLAFTQAELIATIFIIGGIIWYKQSFKKILLIPNK